MSHIDDNACLLALYVNALDTLAHFIPLFFPIALRNTTKPFDYAQGDENIALRAAQNDAGEDGLLKHQ